MKKISKRVYATKKIMWAGVFALFLIGSGMAFAEEKPDTTAKTADEEPHTTATTPPGNSDYPKAMSTPQEKWKGSSKRVLNWEERTGRSYLIPALEIPSFILMLNMSNRLIYGNETYGTNGATTWEHIRSGPWGFDSDDFRTNQAFHPYQGAIYFGLARSAGLTYWESLGYTFAGSFLWETAGETGHPSINDQVASGISGSFFGEELFRMANLLLESGGPNPGLWREIGAALIYPPMGVNRLVFGERFKTVLPSRNPATFTRFRLGASLKTKLSDNFASTKPINKEVTGDFSIAYGLPGKPGYTYIRPFDYFHFELNAIANRNNAFENIMTRGLLLGKKYEVGDSYRGIWGLYGGYDYISPQIFRVSSTSVSIGTTGQLWLSPAIALQGTALAGPGFGAAGTIAGEGDRDYHYGLTGQGLLSFRLIFGKVAMLDATGREYYISDVGSAGSRGTERIERGNVSFTVRIYDHHGIGIQYIRSNRYANYSNLPDRRQTSGTFSLTYTFLGDYHFGAVEWREN